MLTARAWWLLFCSVALLLFGVLAVFPQPFTRHFPALALLGLTLLLWFGWEWLLFSVRAQTVVRRLQVRRELLDGRGPVTTLWAGRTFRVRVELSLPRGSSLPYLAVTDQVPFGVAFVEGDATADGAVTPGKPLTLEYVIRCPAAGLARFEGVRVQLADLQGLFYYTTFLPAVVVVRVLPALRARGGPAATTKRENALLPPGVHRVRSPGSGSELLDLRDYLPGDPPKTIAWKVSARRDRLITKEFESEVPVRCTLFVDTSNSVRVASEGGKPLDRLVAIAAAVLQANAAARDLTGLCLFDERGAAAVRPDRTGTHRTQLLQMLADAAALAPAAARTDPDRLLPLAYAFAAEVYPYLLRPAINAMPWWSRFVASFPGRPRHRRGVFSRLHRSKEALFNFCKSVSVLTWLALLFCLVGLGLLALSGALNDVVAIDPINGTPVLNDAYAFAVFLVLVVGGVLVAGPALCWNLFFALVLLDALFAFKRRRLEGWRKRLAAILSVRYGLGAGGLEALLEDDDAFALWLQRFLADHQVPYALPPYDAAGCYQFAAPEKVPVLAEALLRAVGKGRDNELFVLLADLLELDDRLNPLLAAVRVALGRHHQVVLVCPWPPGVSPPGTEEALPVEPQGLRALVHGATTSRFHAAYRRVRRAFARLGVPVVCAADDEPVPLILERLNQLRLAGRKR
jgi:uncharacterized protein (DUF58 family)